MAEESSGVSLNLNSSPSDPTRIPQSPVQAEPVAESLTPVMPATEPIKEDIKIAPAISPEANVLESGTISSDVLGDLTIKTSNDPGPELRINPQVGNMPSTQESASTQLYSSENPENDQADLDKVGFDLNIEQEKPASAVDLKDGIGDVVDTIVAESTVNQENEERILSELQQMNPDLDLDIPVATNLSSNVEIARKIFLGVVAISLMVLAYLFFNPAGGTANLTGIQEDPLMLEKEDLSKAKADVIANHYVLAGMAMQDMGESVAKFAIAAGTSDSRLASSAERYEADSSLGKYKETMQSSLKIVEEQLSLAKEVEKDSEELVSDLTIHLTDKVKQTEDPEEKDRLETALKLSRQEDLLGEIKAADLAELNNNEVLELMSSLLANVQTDNMNRLAYVQARRISWTNVIHELEETTRNVDPSLDSISYSSYKFNTDTRKVSVNGKIETPDEKTFTLLTLLIDELNKPDNSFINASNTSFSKTVVSSGEEENPLKEDSYSSNLRLDFNLQ